MPYIKVNPSALASISETLRKNSTKVGQIESDFSRIANRLDWDVRSASDIQKRMTEISRTLDTQANRLQKMQAFIVDSMGKYESVAASVGAVVSNGGSGSSDSFSMGALNWLQELGTGFVDLCKTGATRVKKGLSICASTIAKSWEKKGLVYRAVKGLGAGIKLVSSIATLTCAIAGTGITAGLGAPATVLIGTYALNDAISSCADIWNCTFGDPEAIGEVNLLESALVGVGGQVGEWLGNEEIGQSVGEAIYTIGGLTSTIVSMNGLSGAIKQSPTAGATLTESVNATKKVLSNAAKEVPEALNGLGYIATQSNLRDIPYNMALLTKQVPNIMQVCSDIELVKKGVKYGNKIIDVGVDTVNNFAQCTMIEQPVYLNTAGQVNGTIESAHDLYEMDETFDDIRDALLTVQLVY